MGSKRRQFHCSRAAVRTVPVCALLGGLLVTLFGGHADHAAVVQAAQRQHVYSLAAALAYGLGSYQPGSCVGGAARTDTGALSAGDDGLYLVAVRGTRDSCPWVAGDTFDGGGPVDAYWSAPAASLRPGLQVGGQWEELTTTGETLLADLLGKDFPYPVTLRGADDRILGTLPGRDRTPGPYATISAAVPGTAWTLELHTPAIVEHRTDPRVLGAVVAAVAVTPFLVDLRTRSRDAVRQAELAGRIVVVFDERLDTRVAPQRLRLGAQQPNLLQVLHPADRDRVRAAVSDGPLHHPVRCRLLGIGPQIELTVTGRERVPCPPWHRRGPAAGPGRVLRTRRVHCRFVELDAPEADAKQLTSSLDDDLVLRDVCAAHGELFAARPGDRFAALVAAADRGKLDAAARDARRVMGTWATTTVRLTTGRVLEIGLRRARNTDTFRLRAADTTAEHVAVRFLTYAAELLTGVDGTDERAAHAALGSFLADIAPGWQPARRLNTDGAHLEMQHPDGVMLHWPVARVARLAERLATSACGGRGGGAAGEIARREELVRVLHDQVMQPVVWARLRHEHDPETVHLLGELLVVLRGLVDRLRTPPWQEALQNAVADADAALRDAGVGVSSLVDLPVPLTAGEERLVLGVLGESYAAALQQRNVHHVSATVRVDRSLLRVRVEVAGGADLDTTGARTMFDALDEDARRGGGRVDLRRGAGGWTVDLRHPRGDALSAVWVA